VLIIVLFLLIRPEDGSIFKRNQEILYFTLNGIIFSVKINNVDLVNLYALAFHLSPPTVGWISVRRIDVLTAIGKQK